MTLTPTAIRHCPRCAGVTLVASNATVGVGQAVVAKVGAAWSDVAFKDGA